MAIKDLDQKANAPARAARIRKSRVTPEKIQPTHIIKQDKEV